MYFFVGVGLAHKMNTIEARFWAKVDKSGNCWLWLGSVGKERLKDYGNFYINGRAERAHRVAWMFKNGSIPPGMVICHSCDTPRCVRLSHLFMGTQNDNLKDSVAKGRLYAWHKKVTHCKYGHPLSGENIRVIPHNNGTKRVCRTCHRDRAREQYHRAKVVSK